MSRLVNGLPQSVIDRFHAENPEQKIATASSLPHRFYADAQGTYHALDPQSGRSACEGSLRLTAHRSVIAAPGNPRVCTACRG